MGSVALIINAALFLLHLLPVISTDRCPAIENPENGKVYQLHQGTRDAYTVFCNQGYVLEGANVVTCINGEWNAVPPTCRKSGLNQCPHLPTPTYGSKSCNNGNGDIGSWCSFRCQNGFNLQGSELRQCQENLEWSGTQPTCITYIRECPAPLPLINGTVDRCSPQKRPRVGQSCSFRCNLGYTLHGPSSLFCRNNGKLTDETGKETRPSCIATSTPSFQHRTSHATDTGKSQMNETSPHAGKHGANPLSDKTPSYDALRLSPFDNQCSHNLGCSHLCIQENGTMQCACHEGYGLEDDNRTCSDIDECAVGLHDCDHQCINVPGSFRCSCMPGFSPVDNNKCEDIDECANKRMNHCEQRCHNKLGSYTCSCFPGFVLADNGRCNDINECLIEPHVCDHKCINTRGSYRCSCSPGYFLNESNTCEDIDECASERMNRCHQKCHNTVGSYNCSCFPGYVPVDNRKCEGCPKNYYRSENDELCVECPPNSFTLSPEKSSIEDCHCLPGFKGDPTKYIPCEDIDECESDNFGCSDKCVNMIGSVYCSCPVGFHLGKDTKTCEDVNECSINNGGCQSLCHNTVGSFFCSCLPGYTESKIDRYSCDDIDECADNNGECSQKCINYPGLHHCSCFSGYRLDSGQENCVAILCPRFPAPHYTRPICKNKKFDTKSSNSNVRPLEMDGYTVDTICKFRCADGFKLTDSSSSIKCLEDGKWNGTVPECKPLQCEPLVAPENGEIHPKSCTTGRVFVKQRCTFTCHRGYRLKGKPIFKCKNNLKWSVEKNPICIPENVSPFLSCPEDVTVDLKPSENSINITIAQPKTNIENFDVHPSWVSIGKPTEFPAGRTDITFSLPQETDKNDTFSCTMSVNVLDKEPPIFFLCPDFITLENVNAYGISVNWEEPIVTDNVGVESVWKSVEPNSTLTPGLHIVDYIAKDAAGNIGSCSFQISITMAHCDDLKHPEKGEANCFDWMFGKLCQPLCYPGYIRDPEETSFYTCDDSGIWSPNDVISPCLEYFAAAGTSCDPGYEFKILTDTDENICMKCPDDTVWSAVSEKCETTAHLTTFPSTYQGLEDDYR